MAPDAFVLGVLGDFGGEPREMGARRFLAVDRDNLDDVMARLGVSFTAAVPSRLDPGELPVALRFSSPDDFHPDRLVARVPALAALAKARATVPTAAELDRLGVSGAPRQPTPAAAPPAGLLDAIVGEKTAPRTGDPALARFLREVAEPALDRTDHAVLARWQQAVDDAIARQLREILHHPRFRALEAAWRALQSLVASAETGPDLVIRVLDLPKPELARDLARDDSALARLVCDEAATFGGTPYAALVADYAFGASEIELALLDVLGGLAARAGAPFIAAARPDLLGIPDFRALEDGDLTSGPPAWTALRRSEAGRHVALCVPRVLLRLPYGPDGEPVESFRVGERLTVVDHDELLWGSPAVVAIGRILTRAFARDGWSMDPAEDLRLTGLPLHVVHEDGEARAVPCAEVVMTETTLRRVAEAGFVPVASVRDADEAVVYGLRTIGGGPLDVRRPR